MAQLHSTFGLGHTTGASGDFLNTLKWVKIPSPSLTAQRHIASPLLLPLLRTTAAFPTVLGTGEAPEQFLPTTARPYWLWVQLGSRVWVTGTVAEGMSVVGIPRSYFQENQAGMGNCSPTVLFPLAPSPSEPSYHAIQLALVLPYLQDSGERRGSRQERGKMRGGNIPVSMNGKGEQIFTCFRDFKMSLEALVAWSDHTSGGWDEGVQPPV